MMTIAYSEMENTNPVNSAKEIFSAVSAQKFNLNEPKISQYNPADEVSKFPFKALSREFNDVRAGAYAEAYGPSIQGKGDGKVLLYTLIGTSTDNGAISLHHKAVLLVPEYTETEFFKNFPQSVLNYLKRLGKHVSREIHRHQTRRATAVLLGLETRLLDDIGIKRSDVVSALAESGSEDASRKLAARAKENSDQMWAELTKKQNSNKTE
ncbi:hypothetical protein GCM10007094_36320 [Pseudovibrio japonicus]|uniref:Uncharacterized protein n=1 Tax=Pseudovibrio japonicus TaxID=366534 RepID=A0ABQ3EJW6_9HYPH|nr:DUF1127 domain-containing protein [Pseudovibrio japonicus]GHB43635.1 hypothetical protein GCM10007094_36320 [Pseudovibrio japonicus]